MVPKESKMSLSQDRGRVCKNGKFDGENDDEAWDYMGFSGLQHFETQNPSRKLLVTGLSSAKSTRIGTLAALCGGVEVSDHWSDGT